MAQNAITAYRPDASLMPTTDDWRLMMDMASSLVPTGFLPESIKRPEQAVAIMLKGRELGVPPMYALSNIAVVKGKPTVSAEMMLALIYRDHGKRAIRVKESTNDHCTIEYRLPGWDVTAYTFTMQDAAKAGLANSNTWKQYPAAMLRARCISAVARMAFPESIAGMYVPGELGEDVTVTDEGEVVSASTAAVEEVDTRTGEIQPPNRDLAMRRLHKVAGDLGIDHDALHKWATQAVKVASLRDVSPDTLQGLTARLEGQEGFPAQFLKKYGVPSDGAVVVDDDEPIEAEYTESPGQFGFDDEGFAALTAAADRDQAASRARA